MAQSMAEHLLPLAKSAVEGTLSVARSAYEEEKNLRKSVQRDLKLISDEFEMMHAFLSDTKEQTDDMTRTLVRQVRNTALDVEDCIDSVVHLDNRSNWWRRLLPAWLPANAPAAALDAAVADLELLKARVEAMGQRNVRYGLISRPTAKTTPQKSVADATKPLDILVEARNPLNKKSSPRDLAELISMNREDLSSESFRNGDGVHHQLRVISVWGTRSHLGTTSIVKKVYDDPEIGKNFVCRAWVGLTHPFDPQAFIRSLVAQLYTKRGSTSTSYLLKPLQVMAAAEEDILVEEFKKQVNDCRSYLIVLEHVSTMVDWEAIRVFLPHMGNDSCVIVHTQELEVASLCVGRSPRVVELERLSDDHSICAFFDDEKSKGEQVAAKIESAQEWLQGFQRVGRQTNFLGLKYLIRLDCPIRHILVCGISGVGKSSLVRQLYYEAMTEPGLFQKFGWVDAPNPMDLRELTQNLLLDLHSGSLHRVSMLRIKDPIQECRALLQQHRCLIVINGLQSTEEWASIKADLAVHDSHPSLIIVIAQEDNVVSSNEDKWYIEGLEFNEALDLFKFTVSKKIGIDPSTLSPQVIKNAKQILPMCGGLPKVIISVAEFVADNYNNEYSLSDIRGSFMAFLEEQPYFSGLRPLFDWTRCYFHSCPDFLKPCVFYLSIFPLNHDIRRRRLVRRWVAEGYARDDEDSNAETNAEGFFGRLFQLSLIQVPGQRVMTNYMWMPLCQVNGFLREYIVSRSMEDNLVFALEHHCSATSSQRTGRHLTVAASWDRDQLVFRSMDLSRLRSLTVFGRWEPFFVSDKMGLLRVLDLENASGVTDEDVDRMLQLLRRLKFLSLRGCQGVTRLRGSSLGGMRHLQTLDVRYTSVVSLPPSITKLPKLQYIRAGRNVPVLDDDNSSSSAAAVEILPPPSSEAATTAETPHSSSPSGPSTSRPPTTTTAARTPGVSRLALGCSGPWTWTRCCHRRLVAGSPNGGVIVSRGIYRMTTLHTLGVIDVSDLIGGQAFLKELRNLTQLHKLGVSGVNEQNCQDLCSAISGHAQLESLSVRLDSRIRGCLNDVSSPPEYLKSLKLYGDAEDELPSWTNKLVRLTKLSLHMATVTQQAMDVLAHLPVLKALHLHLKEFQDGELLFSKDIHSLQVLEVACNFRLRIVTFHPGVMRHLELLKLRCCNVSSIKFSGLDQLMDLNEIWLSGSYGDDFKEHLKSQLQRTKINLVTKKEHSS